MVRVSKALFETDVGNLHKSCFLALRRTKHSAEPQSAQIVFSKGFHDLLSLDSIVLKSLIKQPFVQICQLLFLKDAFDT